MAAPSTPAYRARLVFFKGDVSCQDAGNVTCGMVTTFLTESIVTLKVRGIHGVHRIEEHAPLVCVPSHITGDVAWKFEAGENVLHISIGTKIGSADSRSVKGWTWTELFTTRVYSLPVRDKMGEFMWTKCMWTVFNKLNRHHTHTTTGINLSWTGTRSGGRYDEGTFACAPPVLIG